MKTKRMTYPLILLIMIAAFSLFLTACSTSGKAADPGDWGFDCLVTYHALGGVVNNREVRETYYMKNSYIFKPAGTTNMLIEPVRDGYVLAGWYTAKEDLAGAEGLYTFREEDRWDFQEDRVTGDMTLYARWVPQGRVDYVDAATGEVRFSKNITSNEAIQPLTSAVEQLIAKPGMTFDGYYADQNLLTPYPFNTYVHKELIPTNQEVYDQLFLLFPQYMKKIEFEEPSKEDLESQQDFTDLYINRLGYEITTDDQAARAEIRKAKDRILEEAIDYYAGNTADKIIYLKYSEGRFIQVSRVSDLKVGGKVGFFDQDQAGNPIDGYIFTRDVDFSGETVTMADSFSGKLVGNGYSLKNIRLVMKPKKMDQDKHKDVALFGEMDGAEIENLTFANMKIEISVDPGISVNAAPLAIRSSKSRLTNVVIDGLIISTGKGDDGQALYRLGDLFVEESGTKLDKVQVRGLVIEASDFAEINRLID
ncbi:MAG: InlB B-repeat-containing protein [Saccharofermentanales bacterium]